MVWCRAVLMSISEWMLYICLTLSGRFKVVCSRDVIPKLISRESSLAKHLVRRRGLLNRPFRTVLPLRNAHVQTLAGLLCPALGDFRFDREYLQVRDGLVALDWYTEPEAVLRRNSPILLVFPRLTGDANSVGGLCRFAMKKGFRPVVLNRRGHGGSFMSSSKLTSTGDANDTHKAVALIFERYSFVPIVAVGIGAGCATLFSYLGERGSSSRIKAAVCISPTYDNTIRLCEQIPFFYQIIILIQLKFTLIANWKIFRKAIDFKRILLRCWSLKEFDFHVYCKMYGISKFETFWQRNDPMRDVDDIAAPVLCINSEDDPVSAHSSIPQDVFRIYPNLFLVTLAAGGHCAFHENVMGDSWAHSTALTFIEGVLEFMSNSRYWGK